MKQKILLSLLIAGLFISCSKKEEHAPGTADSTAMSPAPAAATAPASQQTPNVQPSSSDAVKDAKATEDQKNATPNPPSVAEPKMSGNQATAEKLARGYVMTTTLGKENKTAIELISSKKGYGENGWFFTYHMAKKHEITVQTTENIAAIYGKMKEIK